MKNRLLKIFYLIIVFVILFGCSQVHATLKTFTNKPSYWNGQDNYNSGSLGGTDIQRIMYNNQEATTNNAFVNVSWRKKPSEWGNCVFTSQTAEFMCFLNKYINDSSISDLSTEVKRNDEAEFDKFIDYIEKYFSKSSSDTFCSFIRTLEDVPKNEGGKYNTDGVDGYTQAESSALYNAYIVKNAEEFCKDTRTAIQKLHIAQGKTYTVGGKTISYNDDINTKKNYTKAQMQEYIKQYGEFGLEPIKNDKSCKDNWTYNLGINLDNYNNEELKKYIEDKTGKKITELQSISKKAQENVETKNENGYAAYEQGEKYYLPERKEKDKDTSTDLDQIIDGADKFMNSVTKNEIEATAIQNLSNTIYNILLVVGIIIAIIIGAVIGIMFITGSVEQKADVKKLLIPYIVGCVVVFGSFAIWKIAVTMFSSM